jgi:hypothetical protein
MDNDISHTIIAKSDQLNACDLLGGPITVSVKKVDVRKGADQPVSIHIGGDRQPFKPCKSVLRVLAKLWGTDSSLWTDRQMVLYCDEEVTWAGEQCGGIRVSHMSHIDNRRRDQSLALKMTDYIKEIPLRASKHKVLKVKIHPIQFEFIDRQEKMEILAASEKAGMAAPSLKAWIREKFGYADSSEIQTCDLDKILAEIPKATATPLDDCSMTPEDIKGEIEK